MRKFLFIFVAFFIISDVSFSINDDFIVDFEEEKSASDLYNLALELEGRYPDIISVEVLARSYDQREIFVLILSDNVQEIEKRNDSYVDKMHYYNEGGTHGRENVSPLVLLKCVELYALDYYDDSIVPEYNMKDILNSSAIHFIPLVNPDGYDLSSIGISAISDKNKLKILSYQDKKYSIYKSNLNGVDINRNFPNYYYDIKLEKWMDIWNVYTNKFKSSSPSGAYYFGPSPGSEIETQVVMYYSLRYDFRNYLSFHNKGEVIYWDKWMLSDQHNLRTKSLVQRVADLTGFRVIDSSIETTSSGYFTDFVSMNTLKPSLTIELVNYKYTLPAGQEIFNDVYENMKYVVLEGVKDGNDAGYFRYRLYKDGKYLRDFEEWKYVSEIAKKDGGQVIQGFGRPKMYLDENKNHITRLEAVKMIARTLDDSAVDQRAPFSDCNNILVTRAKSLGIISGYNNKFRPYDYMTYEELYSIIRKAYYDDYVLKEKKTLPISNPWILECFLILSENNIVDYTDINMGKINTKDFKDILEKLSKS